MRDDYPGRLAPGDYAQPDRYSDAPSLADFCDHCGEERGCGDLWRGTCPACVARVEATCERCGAEAGRGVVVEDRVCSTCLAGDRRDRADPGWRERWEGVP